MPNVDYLTSFLGIQGFKVVGIERVVKKGFSAVILAIERTGEEFICGKCHQVLNAGYDSQTQVVQHLRFWQHLTFLRFKRYRVECPNCGVTTEAINFKESRSRITTYLAKEVYELCKVMTNKAVALFECLNPKTVKNIDKRAMQDAQDSRSLEGISALGVDEIFVGDKIWHLVSALESPHGSELLYIGKGRKEKDLKKFWKWFGIERAGKIKVAVMDMWKGFINSFKANCPNAQILYDKFHVMRHLLEYLNAVRKQVLRKSNKVLTGMLIGKKFILLSRQAHVRGKAREALNQLLSMSKKLFKAYLLKESFAHLWSYKSKTWAKKFWKGWKDSLKWSRLKPYQQFVKMIDKHLDGILAYCDHKVSLGFIEATNLKARNIIRRAYGYRDEGYMKLKIIQACSSLGRFDPQTIYFTHTFGY
jgi:transposase